jgi:hypothetical protein
VRSNVWLAHALGTAGREAYFRELVHVVKDWEYATDDALALMQQRVETGEYTEAYFTHMWEDRLSVSDQSLRIPMPY